MFERFARFLLQHRYLFIVASLLITVVMALPLVPPDKIRFDFSFRRLFRFDGEEAAQLTRFKNLFGDDAGTAGVLYVADGPAGPRPAALSPKVAFAMTRLQEWLTTREELDQAFTLSCLTAADFYADPVQPGALEFRLNQVSALAMSPEELAALWAAESPLSGPLAAYHETAGRILDHEIYQGMLLSESGDAAAVIFRFNMSHMHPTARRDFLAELDLRVASQRQDLGDEYQVHAFGIPVVSEEYTRLSIQDIIKTAPASMAVMTLFLFLLFGTLTATFLPQLVVLLAVIWSVGMMQLTDEPLNIISHIVPVMVLVVGVADAVHILSRYTEERHRGRDKDSAVRETVAMLSKACFLTSATTAIGFASLSTATIATIASFGVYTAISVMFTYIVNMTLLPVGLSITGTLPRQSSKSSRLLKGLEAVARFSIAYPKWVFGGGLAFAGVGLVVVVMNLGVDNHLLEEVFPSNPVYQATKTVEERLSPVIPYELLVSGKVHEGMVCASDADCRAQVTDKAKDGVTCVVTGKTRQALAPIRDGMAKLVGSDQLQIVDELEQRIGRGITGAAGVCIESVKDPKLLSALDRVSANLLDDDQTTRHLGRIESLAGIVKQMHKAMRKGAPEAYSIPDSRAAVSQVLVPLESASQELLDRYTTLDYDATRVTLFLKDHGSSAWDEVRTKLDEEMAREVASDPDLAGRFDYMVTGTMNFVQRALSFIVHDMLVSLSTAFFFIFVLMVLLFRSLRIGLLSILPNIFPLLATLVLMAVVGIELRTATIIIFSISLGIAVNDTIHFIARFNEEMGKGAGRDDAIVTAMRSAGRAMVVTTLILSGGFLVDLICDFVALQQFGYLASFTLVMALVGDLILLPACLVLFVKRSN